MGYNLVKSLFCAVATSATNAFVVATMILLKINNFPYPLFTPVFVAVLFIYVFKIRTTKPRIITLAFCMIFVTLIICGISLWIYLTRGSVGSVGVFMLQLYLIFIHIIPYTIAMLVFAFLGRKKDKITK